MIFHGCENGEPTLFVTLLTVTVPYLTSSEDRLDYLNTADVRIPDPNDFGRRVVVQQI